MLNSSSRRNLLRDARLSSSFARLDVIVAARGRCGSYHTHKRLETDRQYLDSRSRMTIESRYDGVTEARSSASLEVTNSASFEKEGCSH